ncbi:hypothetical protein Q1695_003188 [Nippostrongylus brasiliensis]|nr:hypothetical protein Q1695_003188 [Nippostrongylus brasiliensis]
MKPGMSITADVYCNQLDSMMNELAIKHPRLLNRDRPILLQDNARPHVARRTLQKLQELDVELLIHPPYSPDLAPTDYHIFQSLDLFLRDKQFNSQEDVENAFRDFIASRPPGFYMSGMNKLPLRWQKCVHHLGAYFDLSHCRLFEK